MRKVSQRLRSRFNFSIAQLDQSDSWQTGLLGAVSVGANRQKLQQVAERLVREAEDILGSDLLRSEIELFEHD